MEISVHHFSGLATGLTEKEGPGVKSPIAVIALTRATSTGGQHSCRANAPLAFTFQRQNKLSKLEDIYA